MNKKLTYGQKVFWSDLAKLQDCTIERVKKNDSELVSNFKKPIEKAEKMITPIISNWLLLIIVSVSTITAKVLIESIVEHFRN